MDDLQKENYFLIQKINQLEKELKSNLLGPIKKKTMF
jgi:hypothetical protein